MTSPERSRVMRAVKGKDTKPELVVRSLLHGAGYRFRLHRGDLPGKPDLAFPGRRKAVFVHGCFWHGHDCKRGARAPKENSGYWREKIARNKERDRAHRIALEDFGWSSLAVWECELGDRAAVMDKLRDFLDPAPRSDWGARSRSLRRKSSAADLRVNDGRGRRLEHLPNIGVEIGEGNERPLPAPLVVAAR